MEDFTAEEVGAYVLMMCRQWDKGFVEKNDKTLKKVSRISVKKLENVLKKFEENDGKLINLRLEKERKKKAEYSDTQSDNAKKRWAKEKAKAEPSHMPPHQNGNALLLHTSSSTSTSNNDVVVMASASPAFMNSFLPLEDMKQRALKDEAFVTTFFRIGLLPDKLPGWVDAFHRYLEFSGQPVKQEVDYRKHFGNWVTKLPYKTTNGADYNPVNPGNNNNSNGTTGGAHNRKL